MIGLLGSFSITRLFLNTGHRMIYPFLPTIARGLDVSLGAVALTVTARSALALFSPVFGLLADLRGRKTAMLAGMSCFAAGMLLVALWPSYPALFAGLLIAMIGKLLFDPSMQAFLGDRIHYTRRGLAVAITEMSWSGAFLLCIPLAGWLIDRTGRWQAPFPWLAGLGMLSVLLLWRVVPADRVHHGTRPALTQGFRLVISHTPAVAGLVMGVLINAANETISIVYGAWLEDSFEMKVAALGAASAVIGLAELGGEGLVAGLVDRLGKRQAASLGIFLNSLACVALPLLDVQIESALVGLFLLYLTFEFTLVSTIPLMTELVPGARATLMAAYSATLGLGRMVGTLIGPPLFEYGLLANGLAVVVLNVGALVALLVFIREES